MKSVLSSCAGLAYTNKPNTHFTSHTNIHSQKEKKKKEKWITRRSDSLAPGTPNKSNLSWEMIYPVLQPHYSAATHPPSLRHPFPEPSIRPLEFHPNFRKRPPRSRGFWWEPDVVWWRMEKALYYVISAESAIKSVLGDEVLKRHGSRPGLIDGLGWVIRRGGGLLR